MTENPSEDCKHLESAYPLAPPKTIPPIFTPVENNHTCVTRVDPSGINVGQIPSGWCVRSINVTDWINVTSLNQARSDVYWYCGGNRLKTPSQIPGRGLAPLCN